MRISSALWETLIAHVAWYWVLRKLAEVPTKQLHLLSAVLVTRDDVGYAYISVMLIQKKGWKEDLGNYRSVSLTSVLGKLVKQIILSAIMQHMQDSQDSWPSQLQFMKLDQPDLL